MTIKKHTLAFLLAFPLATFTSAQPSVTPLPATMQTGNGTFLFPKTLKVAADAYTGDSIQTLLNDFAQRFTAHTGVKTQKAKMSKAVLQLHRDETLGGEAYRLHITEKQIKVEAARPAGFFYALQTLQQLLPSRAVLADTSDARVVAWTLPVVEIQDAPRFAWRGFMLDEGRHFFGKEAVKKILDVMSAYKMNRFHWHLTEDQGWRIEIKKYPRLTAVGAWRGSRTLPYGEVPRDSIYYGGYYSQDDVREIVAYARSRFIEIIPEIDIPGHSQAAVAAYPELLACDPENPHSVWIGQGVSTDVINVANPQAVVFAQDVLDELIGLFPFGYIHLGGDECPTQKWENNAMCGELLKKIGSKNYRDLQIHFYKQLKDYIAAKPKNEQRKLIFWNEVLHGNTASLGKDMTIMAWTGADAAALDAAQKGFTTILSPQIPYYINRRQSKLPTEPRSQGHGTETVEAVYAYEPLKNVPAALQQQYLGVQANFWTEWVEDAPTVEYLMFPRLAAVAEAAWTPQPRRSYPDFLQRLQSEAQYYQFKKVNYGKHVFK